MRVNPNLTIELSFNISNRDAQDIYVYIYGNAYQSGYSPDFLLGKFSKRVLLKGYNDTTVVFRVSYLNLFWGVQSSFIVKQLNVQYARVEYTAKTYARTVTVYPPFVSNHCGAITAAGGCIRMPACVYCITGADYRSLRSTDIDEGFQSAASFAENINHSSALVPAVASMNRDKRRMLFTDVIPFSMLTQESSSAKDGGFCVEGWTASACESPKNSSYRLKLNYLFYIFFIVIICVFI